MNCLLVGISVDGQKEKTRLRTVDIIRFLLFSGSKNWVLFDEGSLFGLGYEMHASCAVVGGWEDKRFSMRVGSSWRLCFMV